MTASIGQARAVKNDLAHRFANHPSVGGIGLTRAPQGGWAVKVSLRCASPEPQLPREIDGVLILTDVVGRIVAR